MNRIMQSAARLLLAGGLFGWATAGKAGPCDYMFDLFYDVGDPRVRADMERLYDCTAITARQPGRENLRQWFDTAVNLCRNDRRVPPQKVKECAGAHLYRLGRYLATQDQGTVRPSSPPSPPSTTPPLSGEAQRVMVCAQLGQQFARTLQEQQPGGDPVTLGMAIQMYMQQIGCASPSR